MKHKLLRGYYDRYNEKVEEMLEEDLRLKNKIAILETYNYYIGSVATVSLNYLNKGQEIVLFGSKIKEMKNDIYIKKKYGNIPFMNNKDDFDLFLKKLYESFFIGIYQDFEVYIYQNIKAILWFNPDCMDDENKYKYYKYRGKNVLLEREKFLERYISKLSMRSKIDDMIEYLMGLINENVECVLGEYDKSMLYHISLIRNLIVHNSGIVNSLFLTELKDKGILFEKYKNGKYIFEGCDDPNIIVTNDISAFIGELVNRIYQRLEEYFK